MNYKLNGALFKKMLMGGTKALEINRAMIDELNVFPVPDGDTGTNMSLTISTAIKEVNLLNTDELCEIALAFSKGALKGARGNSGVILSQIFKGFAVAFDALIEITPKDIANGIKKGTEIAYSAVTKPKEGTILTVVRVMAENAVGIAKTKNISIEEFFSEVLESGENILQKTPEMLPVLAKAGVVDAGGKGLLTIFDGMYKALIGEEIVAIENLEPLPLENVQSNEFETLDNDYENITFQYCTEFFITHLKNETTESDIDKFRDYLQTIGDCVLVIGDIELIKTHVHTNNPGLALQKAVNLGELDGVKIENMLEQHRKIVGEKEENAKPKEMKETAMISICSGVGMANIFKDLLVDITVEGGQTMNPSVYDILGAINNANAKNVFVFPNNTNIILAANQAKELADVNVYVVPTTCMPEGISAALVFNENASAKENYENMKNAASGVTTTEITHAVRSTRMNGFSVKEGDIIGICNKKIISKSNSLEEATINAVNKIAEDADMLTLYYGEDVTESDAKRVASRIEEINPELEIAYYFGGQPHYFYIISAE